MLSVEEVKRLLLSLGIEPPPDVVARLTVAAEASSEPLPFELSEVVELISEATAEASATVLGLRYVDPAVARAFVEMAIGGGDVEQMGDTSAYAHAVKQALHQGLSQAAVLRAMATTSTSSPISCSLVGAEEEVSALFQESGAWATQGHIQLRKFAELLEGSALSRPPRR